MSRLHESTRARRTEPQPTRRSRRRVTRACRASTFVARTVSGRDARQAAASSNAMSGGEGGTAHLDGLLLLGFFQLSGSSDGSGAQSSRLRR